jgi:hypothetical protein
LAHVLTQARSFNLWLVLDPMEGTASSVVARAAQKVPYFLSLFVQLQYPADFVFEVGQQEAVGLGVL